MANHEDDPFQILQLPLTMKDMVLPKLSVFDLYNLSCVSDETKNWVKYYVQNKNYRLKTKADEDYGISLFNPDKQVFDIILTSVDRDANYEFYLGDFPVLTKKEVIAPNRMKINVLTERLDAQWNRDNAIKSFIAHLSDVFTKDVCVSIGYHGEKNERKIMKLVKDLNLKVHCYNTDRTRGWWGIKKFTKYPRVCVDGGTLNTNEVKSILEQWMKNGTMDYLEIYCIPDDFNFNNVVGPTIYTETIKETQRSGMTKKWNYSVTRSDGASASVEITHGSSFTDLRGRLRRLTGKFVIKCQTDLKYSTCFDAR